MSHRSTYIIVEKSDIAYGGYIAFVQQRDWTRNIERLHSSLPTLDPSAYRGISRNPITAFPTADLDQLSFSDSGDVALHTTARLAMLEFQQRVSPDDYGHAMLATYNHAQEVYILLDPTTRNNYELLCLRQDEQSEDTTIGYDIGYWGGDFFSIICDSMIMPMWHPPSWDDLPSLAQQAASLNSHCLFPSYAKALAFRSWYCSCSWAEQETKQAPFDIIRVDTIKW